MTYDASEKSQYGGQPVECYKFTRGGSTWYLTSGDAAVTIAAGTFTPAYVRRGAQDFNGEDAGGGIEVRLRRDHEIASPFIPFLPSAATWLTIWRFHRGHEGEALVIFIGRVTGVKFVESEAVLQLAPITSVFTRKIPVLAYQSQCAWPLYSTQCGVDPDDFDTSVEVEGVSGADVVSADFDALADGWFTSGFILRSDGSKRFVVNHVGDTVTLNAPFSPVLTVGETVTAYAGCDRTEAACADKFSNLGRYMGFTRIPTRNPHAAGL